MTEFYIKMATPSMLTSIARSDHPVDCLTCLRDVAAFVQEAISPRPKSGPADFSPRAFSGMWHTLAIITDGLEELETVFN